MRTLPMNKKAVAILAAGLLTVATAGGAYAYWTQSGTGTGTAATGTTTSITVKQTTTPTAMYPGSTPQSLAGNFTNPNPGAVQISAVTAVVSSVTGGGTGLLACTPADYKIDGTAPGSLVPAGAGPVGSWTGLTIELLNSSTNQDLCKNAVANITYTAVP